MEEKVLIGFLSGTSELIGMLSDAGQMEGELSIPDRLGNKYDGTYDIIPSSDFQLLPTAECYLEDDMIVHPIPYAEVSNLSGGYTANIGG